MHLEFAVLSNGVYEPPGQILHAADWVAVNIPRPHGMHCEEFLMPDRHFRRQGGIGLSSRTSNWHVAYNFDFGICQRDTQQAAVVFTLGP